MVFGGLKDWNGMGGAAGAFNSYFGGFGCMASLVLPEKD